MTGRKALVRCTRGEIAYVAGDGASIGRERFEIATQAGGRSVRALCEMDDIGLLRDVSMALDPQWRPLDAFCRITRDGRTAAATWFNVTDGALEMTGEIAGLGRIAQRLAPDPPIRYLGLHPLQGDALVTAHADRGRVGTFTPVSGATNSLGPNGDTGLYATPIVIDVAYMGDDTIDVPAGRFAAWRFALRWNPAWPPADIWVRRGDFVFLQLRWSLIETGYVLTHLAEDGE